jgi:UDP-N-acetylglucosamine transferase subunit ALG13
VIFVTIGSMFPFDRLIMWMDAWARDHPGQELLAQIGDGAYEPSHMPWERMLPPSRFESSVRDASLIVAHAGMGSIITAMELGKPIILVPRRLADREHTTDHQMHTASWMRGKPGIQVVETQDELAGAIEAITRAETTATPERISNRAPEAFTMKIRDFLTRA